MLDVDLVDVKPTVQKKLDDIRVRVHRSDCQGSMVTDLSAIEGLATKDCFERLKRAFDGSMLEDGPVRCAPPYIIGEQP